LIIYDTFLFSEPYEADLLYLKCVLEDSGVDGWFVQENVFTLQGDPKQLHAQDIVLSQDRFQPFRHKIHFSNLNNKVIEGKDENHNFLRERNQRIAFLSSLSSTFQVNQDTYFIVSDVDEMIDFSDEDRSRRFKEACEQNKERAFWIQRMRYWYDYDNRCYLDDIHIPVVPIHLLHYSGAGVIPQSRHFKDYSRCYGGLDNPIAFEYSYVFKTIEDLYRKKCTYAHTGFTMESLEEGLRTNSWPRPKERGESRGPHDFFETVELTPENSPKYVRENLELIKTNTVDKNYRENRKVV
jgi:hypothetical protein